ncbi:nucleoside triphosphate pyrophosphohydrolase [Trichlorobacter lovleyi]|uniref:Nucleoside triphosphate pyrophosphohydrolase n=1 Tax=Trichlorobacter lovleyi (strain ATCC BAA-1151 / DSM 17278 / SZ) TaxID=398767 RepID=B3E3E3_TRIL1|nr:nucleoside triphosphate pyrophosphohydrolase [Trichlorobacter lovleyi]ACD95762.1 MazG family protein [Trichlorobacter lovleyi SZ]
MTTNHDQFNQVMSIMRRLRAPGGCPWDAEQSHESLKRYLLEESYEVLEAIDSGSDEQLKEELGDLLLQPVFHAAIAEERGAFTIEDVLASLSDKLIRRHPHVFGDQVITDSEAQVANWEKIKKAEKGEERRSALSGIPPHLPALMKAQKITEKASRVGFDWEHVNQVMAKVLEELHEFEEAMEQGRQDRMEAELGDLLFAIVNLGRFLALDPEEALRKTIARFQNRFSYIEERLHVNERHLQDASLDEMEALWVEAKSRENS